MICIDIPKLKEKVKKSLTDHNYSIISLNKIYNFLQDEKQEFCLSWNNLEKDNYLQEDYIFRLRRYGKFILFPIFGYLIRLPGNTYYQSYTFNKYAGGKNRIFSPISEELKRNLYLIEIIKFDFECLNKNILLKALPWMIGIHQMRIVSRNSKTGYPTPEGIHQDGHDFNVIHFINKYNVDGGISKIYDEQGKLIRTFILEKNMDSMYLNDRKVLHEVTPISVIDTSYSGYRDVMTVNFTCLFTILLQQIIKLSKLSYSLFNSKIDSNPDG